MTKVEISTKSNEHKTTATYADIRRRKTLTEAEMTKIVGGYIRPNPVSLQA
jgi:hypothetical protein